MSSSGLEVPEGQMLVGWLVFVVSSPKRVPWSGGPHPIPVRLKTWRGKKEEPSGKLAPQEGLKRLVGDQKWSTRSREGPCDGH